MMKNKWRKVDGILLLDKPIGISSNAALQRVRRLYQAAKAGHTGNLDPLATGLLPVCLGEATKITPYLLNAGKRYQARITLGERTAAGDAEGPVIERRPVPPLDNAGVAAVLAGFCGERMQTPPMHSALKHQGQPLYKLAVRGITIERQPRSITITALTLLDFDGVTLTIDVSCSKGTYVRVLAEEIGTALSTCAHLSALRRTEVHPFSLAEAVTLETLAECAETGQQALDKLLRPMDQALSHWPVVSLDERTVTLLQQGQQVPTSSGPVGLARIYGPSGSFLGMGEIAGGLLVPRRLLSNDKLTRHRYNTRPEPRQKP
jgi:tRNA pseudouridine55 synthase